ncbi:MAG: class I SAM-dependent methyltransferase [Sphingomonadaceae bacterium]|nr:class I SAM-dependent methyltransferase [Sphingomonadaceae bacterium]
MRTEICYRLSRNLIKPPSERARNADSYSQWRDEQMYASWQHFSNTDIDGKDVLDFGCGEGPLSLYLARICHPKSILGVEIDAHAIERANMALARLGEDAAGRAVSFKLCDKDGLPVADNSVDTILAFDCMEHVMAPKAILAEWHRVLRPGGKVLIEWYPFKGPYGPHMTAMIPIPWAHVLFGEKALFETAARLYEQPDYIPNRWDLDEEGQKKPNKWATSSTFREQGYLNELTIPQFNAMTAATGFKTVRFDKRGFGQSGPKAAIGKALLKLPVIDEYFVNYSLIELQK